MFLKHKFLLKNFLILINFLVLPITFL